jgi:hypothetical protein
LDKRQRVGKQRRGRREVYQSFLPGKGSPVGGAIRIPLVLLPLNCSDQLSQATSSVSENNSLLEIKSPTIFLPGEEGRTRRWVYRNIQVLRFCLFFSPKRK